MVFARLSQALYAIKRGLAEVGDTQDWCRRVKRLFVRREISVWPVYLELIIYVTRTIFVHGQLDMFMRASVDDIIFTRLFSYSCRAYMVSGGQCDF